MFNYIILFIAIVFAVSGQILLKRGSMVVSEVLKSPKDIVSFGLSMLKSANIMGGLVLFGIAFVMWVWILSKMQLHVVYPVSTALQIALLSLGSWLLLKEALSIVQVVGIGIIILGIFLLLKPL
ncbi:MAG: hypothetical protein Q8Q06_04710 [bacterium]|nr:hypothetical protein [bacterium]